MGAWQPDNVIPEPGSDGVPQINWSGPAGAPFDFDLKVPDGHQNDTWLGQIRATPDAPTVTATFDPPAWGTPADGFVIGTFVVLTTALTAGQCYVFEIAYDAGDGFVPVIGGSLSPGVQTARP